jgi:hypothetical protein
MKSLALILVAAALSITASGLTAVAQQSSSQQFIVTGSVLDSATREPLIGMRIRLQRSDSSLAGGAVSNTSGIYTVRGVQAGQYTLSVQSIGHKYYRRTVQIRAEDARGDTVKIPPIRLAPSVVKTDEVDVTATAIRAEVKGDTTEFNAKAFKADRNAAADDLIRKMPGIEVSPTGSVTAQGEQVRRVLVDGKPFFGDDPTAALRNLPSEIIDKVQVIDQMSDQAAFTRFDDGDRTKTLNIITNPAKRNGQFGKLYGGYGSNTDAFDSRYTAGGNVNFFNGDRRISLIGMSNNINQQNFSIQDILGLMGGGGNQMRAFGAAMGGGMANMMRAGGAPPPQMMRGGNGGAGGTDPSSFLVGQSDGITAAHALGLNYSDTWAKDLTVTGSYFANYSDNTAQQDAHRQYFLTDGAKQLNEQSNQTRTKNMNHRANLRVEYTLDSANSFVFTPRITIQTNDRATITSNSTATLEGLPLNASAKNNTSNNVGLNFGSDLLWRHRFALDGRTLSANITTAVNSNTGDARNTSLNNFFNTSFGDIRDSIRQDAPSDGRSTTLGANVNYTEPIHDKGSLQASYNVNLTRSESDRKVYDFNTATSDFDKLNTPLSNTFQSSYFTQRPGLTYRYNFATGATFSVGADYQIATLNAAQTYPNTLDITRTFTNILPSATLTMRFGRTGNLRFNYRASTNAPSVRQLQNVLDNSDPLRLSAGNPDLVQEYTHNFNANFGTVDMQTARMFFVGMGASFTSQKIESDITIAQRDTTITMGDLAGKSVRLGSGAQLTRPVNLDGYMTARAFVVYGFPFEPFQGLRLNMNVSGSGVYTRDPDLINGVKNFTDSYTLTPAITASSNISENLDFTVSWRTAYSVGRNTVFAALNTTYFTHTAYGKLNWVFGDGFVVASDFTYTANVGLTDGFNQAVPLLSVGIGKRFWDGNGELKLSMFDVLNQNTSISRNVSTGYIEDVQTAVLRRYALLTFTYNLRAFGS